MSKSNKKKNLDIINFIKSIYGNKNFIPLHEPKFIGNEKKYLNECINSSFVSSVGNFVDKLEESIKNFTGAKFAIATNSGTSALHISLLLAGVDINSEVITQPLTFVATCNAISYCGASPIFLDVDKETMGLSPFALKSFLENNTIIKNQKCYNKKTNKIIKACIPMHTYGHPCRIDEIREICEKYFLFLIEDAAESLGSSFKNNHTGTFGNIGVFSFNGNKIITAGGGGCIITNDLKLAKKAKHLTTTAKIPHKWNFDHDLIGYNYRMPNINAALLLAQIESLKKFIKAKRKLANTYKNFFETLDCLFFNEPINAVSNYWLNVLIFNNRDEKDEFLKISYEKGVMTRPTWKLMHKLKMFNASQKTKLENAEFFEERIVNIPSSII